VQQPLGSMIGIFLENKPPEKMYPEKNKNTRHETNKAIKKRQ
jgi:hypothetical protein